jgi:hypothetical protein
MFLSIRMTEVEKKQKFHDQIIQMCYAGMKKFREHFPCILENFEWIDNMRTNILFYIHIWSSPCISIQKNNFRVIFVTKVQTVGKNRLFKTNIQRN